jgi:hypothetical protein
MGIAWISLLRQRTVPADRPRSVIRALHWLLVPVPIIGVTMIAAVVATGAVAPSSEAGMVSASLLAVAVIAMILPVFALDALEKRGWTAASRLLTWISLAIALSCVAAGIAQHAGWGESIAIAGRAMPYGPSGLIALGLFWAFVYAATLWRRRRS